MNIRILSIQQIDSGSMSASQTITIYIARRIDGTRFTDAVLLARLHATGGTWPSGSSVTFECGADGYTDEDPAQIWGLPAPGGAGTLATFTNSDSAPLVRTGSVATALGFVPGLFFVRYKIATGASTGTIKPTLSADLNLKENK